MKTYRHSQFGYAIALVMVVATLVDAAAIASIMGKGLELAEMAVPIFLLFLFPALGVMFHKLSVVVDDSGVCFSFGLGMIKKRIAAGDIVSVAAVRNKIWYGIGIHYIGCGWLYNVSGLLAVEIKLKNGNRTRIGSDEPEKLAAAVRELIAVDVG
jgi:hypothetical protein